VLSKDLNRIYFHDVYYIPNAGFELSDSKSKKFQRGQIK